MYNREDAYRYRFEGLFMKKERYLIITFPETTMALYMERICKEDLMDGRIIPLPREISAGCGLVWASRDMESARWRAYLEKKGVDYENMLEAMV